MLEALGSGGSLRGPLLVLGVLVLASATVDTLHFWVMERTSERVVLGARRRLVHRLLRLQLRRVDRLSPGDLTARATSDTTLLGQVASSSGVQLVNGTLSLVGALVLMAVVDVALLLTTVGVLVVVAGAVLALLPAINRALGRQQEAVGELGAALERSLGALRTVRASGAEEREAERLDAAARGAYDHGMRAAGAQAVVWVFIGLSAQVAFLAVLGVGGARVASGAMSVTDLIAFLLYLFYLVGPVSELAAGATQLQAGLAAIRRLDEVERWEVEEPETPAGPTAPAWPTSLEGPVVVLEDVRFAYRDDGPAVLDGVSFEVPATGLTALVGPSGAGKTTIFSLVERFYETDGGRVRVAGRDVREWSREALRAGIGYVEQETPVLAGTLRENLVLAAPAASDREIHDAVHRARLDDLVARLPDGLEGAIGPRGTTLSGGERQRVAIARALLRRPSLLLLDEATSQLDAANERALRDTVAEIGRRRAVLTIAHRLSTVLAAERIVVLERGRVRAVGRHEELLEGDALYAALAATQLTPTAGGGV